MPDAPIKFGALCWNQYTDWASLRDAGIRAEQLDYDDLWTWDHLYPIVGSPDGPIFRGIPDPGRLGAGHVADRPGA